ncbi:hypothetical protein Lbys_3275 [Leadbetterella byssophila DSM 17132]|uniref:Uncharacterized protein n=2 Tax=Leadbetterella TaxID=319458 RepID=E4RWJ5_LEAB4|nr:hypothetical protein [Leadbetterella byssophila]ADQ18935.1 hypothetical protein Lbys_3275 [Leadbetterella byssophila DSM 17132]
MKKILIDARDFAFYWSTTQGNEPGGIDGRIKFGVFLLSYYMTLLFMIANISSHLNYTSFLSEDGPTIVRLLHGFILISPILIITYLLLKKLEPVPYNHEMLPQEIKRKRRVYIIGTILGLLSAIFIGIVIPLYLRGGRIEFFNYVLQRGT